MAKRLFVALEPPEYCTEALAALDPGLKGVHWLPRGQMHLTLAFLGHVSAQGEERLRVALSGVEIGPFFLPIEGVGVFGRVAPRVVWAGAGKGHTHLFALHKRIQDAVLHAGLEADLRPFHPHITIARVKGVSRQILLPFLRAHAKTEIGLWKVTGFALFSSVLSPDSAFHTVEMRREFK